MTKEEYDMLEPGDLVTLVDNVRDLIDESDDHTLESVFIPGHEYIVGPISSSSSNWIDILVNEEGNTNHGWPRDRWMVVHPYSQDDFYKSLGMEGASDESV